MSPLAVLICAALVPIAVGCGSDESAGEQSEQAAVQAGATGGGGAGGEGGRGAGQSGDAERARVEARQHERAAQNDSTPEERAAQGQAERFYEILGEDSDDPDSTEIDSGAFCDLMSEEAREETVEFAQQASGIAQQWDCESAIELLVIRAKRTGSADSIANAEVVGVNAEGDRATATVRFGRGPLTSIPLVKEDGEWKLGSSLAEGN